MSDQLGPRPARGAPAAGPAWADEPPTAEAAPASAGELDVRLAARYEWGSAPAGTDPVMSVLLTLTPSGRPLALRGGSPAASRGALVHVVLALDISKSMDRQDKYPVLAEALRRLVAELAAGGPGVLFSLVVFARGRKTLLHAVPAHTLDPTDVLARVAESPLLFTDYTDLAGALGRAGRIAYDSHRAHPALPVRIYVMSDGRPQDLDGAKRMVERIACMPVDVDALAFGADADVELLRRVVAGRRGGTVKHVRAETLEDAYGRIAESARDVVTKRALLRIDTARGVVGGAAFRFRPARHSFGPDAFRRGRSFETDLGTLEAGREYSLLFQVRLPQTADDATEIAEVVLRVPDFGGAREFRTHLAVPRHRDALPLGVDPVVVEAREILEAIDQEDPEALLRSLRARRKIYISERRDPYLLEVVDKAIAELESVGSLASLSKNERAALTAHTATAGSGRPKPTRREYTFG